MPRIVTKRIRRLPALSMMTILRRVKRKFVPPTTIETATGLSNPTRAKRVAE